MGNAIGWIVSAVLLVLTVLLVALPMACPSHSEAAKALKTGFCDKYVITQPISNLVDAEPSGGGNAGDDYARAIDIYNANKEELEAWMKNPEGEPPAPALKIVEIAREATTNASMKYLTKSIPGSLAVSPFHQAASDINTVATIVQTMGAVYRKADQPDQYVEMLKIMAIIGWHMTNERALIAMTQFGLEIQMAAAKQLETHYTHNGQAALAEAAKAYLDSVNDVLDRFHTKRDLVWNTRPQAGEIFYIAENDKDRAWRVQAIMTLGILKFSTEGGDRRYNKKLIKKFLNDGDPWIKAAATSARHLRRSDYNRLGSVAP